VVAHLLLGWVLGSSASFSADVQARTGYDSNVFYNSTADLSDPAGRQMAGDALVQFQPHLAGVGSLGRGRLGVQYDLTLVQFASPDHGYWAAQQLRLSADLVLGRLTIGGFLDGNDYRSSAFRSDRMYRGQASVAAQLELRVVSLALELGEAVRSFPNREVVYGVPEVDQLDVAMFAVSMPLGPLELFAGLRGERVRSNALVLEGSKALLDVALRGAFGRLRIGLIAEGRLIDLPNFPLAEESGDMSIESAGRRDQQVAAELKVGWVFNVLEPFLYGDWESGGSNYLPAVFRRAAGGVGLSVHWANLFESPPSRPPVPEPIPASLLPFGPAAPTAPGERLYRFEFLIEGAGEVRLIGSFNHWSHEGVRLTEDQPGHFVGWIPLPPGRTRYQLIVDGERRTPPDAPSYAPDGMGGLDGVIEVSTDASGQETAR
jgi:hypothetical protein